MARAQAGPEAGRGWPLLIQQAGHLDVIPRAVGSHLLFSSDSCHPSRIPLRAFHTGPSLPPWSLEVSELVGLCSAGEALSLQSPLRSGN